MIINEKIVSEKIPCFFISPHLDDAILSAGGLIASLSQKTDVSIITIFTKATPPPYTLFAKKFLGQCGYADAKSLFLIRQKEDALAFKRMNIKNVYHLGFVDAAWRKKRIKNPVVRFIAKYIPELNYIYPTRGSILSGNVVPEDKILIQKAAYSLSMKIPKHNKIFVFCPLGIGKHIDHLITRAICVKCFSSIIYWSDFPYNQHSPADHDFIKKHKLRKYVWFKNLNVKKRSIAHYASQIASLFPNKHVYSVKEYFYGKQL